MRKPDGIIAATFTPFGKDGFINLAVIPSYIDHLLQLGVRSVFVNGTAGEFASLTVAERKQLAESWLELGRGKLDFIMIHCGANSLLDSQELAMHAAGKGADCVALMAPSYFKTLLGGVVSAQLVDFCSRVAECIGTTPFLYYHIPAMNGVLGVTYNIIGDTVNKLVNAFEDGEIAVARKLQCSVQTFWSAVTEECQDIEYVIAALKQLMASTGVDVGPPRPPLITFDLNHLNVLQSRLRSLQSTNN